MRGSATWELTAVEQLVELAGRDKAQARRVVAALRRYLREDIGDVRKLSGRSDEWRLRVGDWRVVFTIGADDGVHILALLPRRDAYE
jgi:mRNA-degrading endonuclease RelE of RelBE toxin-antitoxin system